MSKQDLVSDFVARVNNSRASGKQEVTVVRNNLIEALCKKLVKMKFFDSFEKKDYDLTIKFNPKMLGKLLRVSKPGKRFFTTKDSFPSIIGGYGFNLVSTSKGVMSHMECLKEGLGGEVILQVIKS